MPRTPPRRLLLGIDAGGACTDAALLDEARAALGGRWGVAGGVGGGRGQRCAPATRRGQGLGQ